MTMDIKAKESMLNPVFKKNAKRFYNDLDAVLVNAGRRDAIYSDYLDMLISAQRDGRGISEIIPDYNVFLAECIDGEHRRDPAKREKKKSGGILLIALASIAVIAIIAVSVIFSLVSAIRKRAPEPHELRGNGVSANISYDAEDADSLVIRDINVNNSKVVINVNTALDTVFAIKADENILETLSIKTNGKTLTLCGSYGTRYRDVTITVDTNIDFSDYELIGGVELYIERVTKDTALNVAGACSATLNNIDTANLKFIISGAGAVWLYGKCDEAVYVTNGMSSIYAYDLDCKRAYCTINGMGSAQLYVTEYLNAKVNGMGSIRYKGNAELTKSVSGLGTIRKA